MDYTMKVIARIHPDFPEKFGIPRQSGLVPALRAKIVFEPEYRNPDALRGIEGFSHLWLIWQFSAAVRDTWSPTVRPPRLGGNDRVGVFATRSPFRPNAIGLSCVKLEGVRHEDGFGDVLIVLGADLMDGTPIYDISPTFRMPMRIPRRWAALPRRRKRRSKSKARRSSCKSCRRGSARRCSVCLRRTRARSTRTTPSACTV